MDRATLAQHVSDGVPASVKVAPPLAVIGADKLLNVPIPELVQWITLAYVSLMLAHKLWQVGWGIYKFWVLKQRDNA